jgi:cell division protein FtsW (lipid II flippase)
MTHETQMRPLSLMYFAAPIPALVVGVLTMRMSDVPPSLWVQNVAAWAAGTVLCVVLARPRTSAARPRWADVAAVLTLAALAATLLAPGMDGVHRWLPLGPVRLHAAAVLLPVLIVALDSLSRTRGWWTSALAASAAMLALFLQPDAAQATAFGAAAVLLLAAKAQGRAARLACLGIVAALGALTWTRRDPLAPVPYVEEIVGLAGSLGTGWAVAAVVSLLLLPVPFFVARRGAAPHVGIALGAYVAITAAAPFVGSFPVPVMGYGMSPIVGYLAGLGLFLRTAARGPDASTAASGSGPR